MSTTTPPPIPSDLPPVINPHASPVHPQPPAFDIRQISGAENMSVNELRDALALGGRIVIFQYCISVLVLSFRRASPITFIPPGQSAIGKGTPYSLISLFVGWWGIPWGPIWTISTLITNLGGGKDLTREMMAALGTVPMSMEAQQSFSPMSPVEAADRESKKGFRRALAVGAVVSVVLLLAGAVYVLPRLATKAPPRPGQTEFRSAENHIRRGGTPAAGNSAESVPLAGQMSRMMKILRDLGVEKSEKSSALDAKDEFRTYCWLTETKCVFLVHVPELRRFSPEVKEMLGRAAWNSAQGILSTHNAGKPGMQLAVALRGIAAYDRVLIGNYNPDDSDELTEDYQVRQGIGSERELYSWFVSVNPPAPTEPSTGEDAEVTEK
jgi:hypothetical protein